MKTKVEASKRFLFAGIIIIAMGVTFSTTMKDTVGTFGTILIAIGGLLFIIAMSKKRNVLERNKE